MSEGWTGVLPFVLGNNGRVLRLWGTRAAGPESTRKSHGRRFCVIFFRVRVCVRVQSGYSLSVFCTKRLQNRDQGTNFLCDLRRLHHHWRSLTWSDRNVGDQNKSPASNIIGKHVNTCFLLEKTEIWIFLDFSNVFVCASEEFVKFEILGLWVQTGQISGATKCWTSLHKTWVISWKVHTVDEGNIVKKYSFLVVQDWCHSFSKICFWFFRWGQSLGVFEIFDSIWKKTFSKEIRWLYFCNPQNHFELHSYFCALGAKMDVCPSSHLRFNGWLGPMNLFG